MKKLFIIFILLFLTVPVFSQYMMRSANESHNHNISVWYSQQQSINVEYTKIIGYDINAKELYGAYIGIGSYFDGIPRFTLGLDKTTYGYKNINYRISTGLIVADFKYIDAQLGLGIIVNNVLLSGKINLFNATLGWGRDYEIWEIGVGYYF